MKKGFTLIELLIVIAILAVLAVAVTLIINPAELLKQGRDSNRISDLSTLVDAVSLFLTDVANPTWNTTSTCTQGTYSPIVTTGSTTTCALNTATNITGTGWIPINFGAISSGAPLARLPLDPVNSSSSTACAGTPSGCYYAYNASSTVGVFEIDANMESSRYTTSGGSDVESNTKDGGNKSDWFEVGSNLSLN